MIELICLCGIPASGKSTTMNKYIIYINEARYPINIIHVCLDSVDNSYQDGIIIL